MITIKTMNIKNMKQADFFIKNGLVPIGAKAVDKIAVITFLRDSRCEKVFTKWVNQNYDSEERKILKI